MLSLRSSSGEVSELEYTLVKSGSVEIYTIYEPVNTKYVGRVVSTGDRSYNQWYHYLVTLIVMEREALTIRFPADLLAKARKLKQGSESFNDLIVEALENEVRRRRGWAAHQRIIARSETVKGKTGIQPASTDLIRNLREDTGRRD